MSGSFDQIQLNPVRIEPIAKPVDDSMMVIPSIPSPVLLSVPLIVEELEVISPSASDEIDLRNESPVQLTASAVDEFNVAVPLVFDNVDIDSAGMFVSGYGDMGYKLQTVGAFEERLKSAFFWG